MLPFLGRATVNSKEIPPCIEPHFLVSDCFILLGSVTVNGNCFAHITPAEVDEMGRGCSDLADIGRTALSTSDGKNCMYVYQRFTSSVTAHRRNPMGPLRRAALSGFRFLPFLDRSTIDGQEMHRAALSGSRLLPFLSARAMWFCWFGLFFFLLPPGDDGEKEKWGPALTA